MKVFVRSSYTAEQCESFINDIIKDYPGCEVTFDMAIEQTFMVLGTDPGVLYTLIIQVDNDEDIE